ncbi:MAG TPA: anti-sigma factor [Ktedonobacterales bacterium]|nr:anti-sigma factor [Ktedonobacterales bacterium]
MVDRHVDDLVDAYALGSLEPEEVDAVERHLEVCPDCRALAEDARAGTEELLLTPPTAPVPPDLKQRVLARVRAEREQVAQVSHLPQQVTQPQHHLTEDAAPQHHLAPEEQHLPSDAQSHVAASSGRFRRAMSILFGGSEDDVSVTGDTLRSLLSEPDCVIWPVAGTADAPEATARLVGSPSRRDAVIVTHGLRQPPAGQAYQVWFLRDGKPIPNSLFSVDRAGRGSRVVVARAALAEYDTVAITPEPEEGSLAPTGAIVLAGSLVAAAR